MIINHLKTETASHHEFSYFNLTTATITIKVKTSWHASGVRWFGRFCRGTANASIGFGQDPITTSNIETTDSGGNNWRKWCSKTTS